MKKWLFLIGAALVMSGCQDVDKVDQPDVAKVDQPNVAKVDRPEEKSPENVVEEVEVGSWMTDFENASTKAKAEGKHMLIDFSGSDWCGWCVKLDKEVFSKKAFREYAKENLVLVLADFPRDDSKQSADLKKQNQELSKKFGVRGFPTVYILDPDGKPVAKTGYQAGGPEAYVEHVKKLIADAKK